MALEEAPLALAAPAAAPTLGQLALSGLVIGAAIYAGWHVMKKLFSTNKI